MSDLEVLILRVEAPLLSFGDVAVDEKRRTRELPSRSMLCGLLANALGWHHGDFDRLDRLQARLVFAARRDRSGVKLEDFQTVDLGQGFMGLGWTTRHRPEERKGASGKDTHIRYREYLAGAAYTVALHLEPADDKPTLDDLREALRRPARPLFIGRKTCLPSRPLVGHGDWPDLLRASSVVAALEQVPLWACESDDECLAWWPDGTAGAPAAARRFPITDERDWRNQIHAGRRFLCEGRLNPPTVEGSDA